MDDILDLDRYPLDRPGPDRDALIARCQAELASQSLFNLPGLVCPAALETAVAALLPRFAGEAFTHQRSHNIYFKASVPGLADDHPALRRFDTVNHTLCADQIPGSVVLDLYAWPPLIAFLAAVMGKPRLFTMADPLAKVNVMAYHDGEALNWHFDRSEFTTTLLLQAPSAGGAFEYARDLRSDADPNYDGVAALIDGRLPTRVMPLDAGTLNVFRGKNTAHRVTPVAGDRARVIAVFSYYENPGATFTAEERIGFFGRPA